MLISKKAIVLLVPSLLFGLGTPAWSGSTDAAPPINAQVMPAGNPAENSLLGMLSSVLTGTDNTPHQPKNQCKASQLYSQHDVVGDPEACFMGRYTVGGSATTPPSIP